MDDTLQDDGSLSQTAHQLKGSCRKAIDKGSTGGVGGTKSIFSPGRGLFSVDSAMGLPTAAILTWKARVGQPERPSI